MAREARRTIRRPLALALGIALVVALSLLAGRVARTRTASDLAESATAALPLASATLTGVIEKERLVPLVLARDPEVIALLARPEPAAERRLDAKLADIAGEAGAAVIYVVGRDGVAVAASNAARADSFVGSGYGFRHYFSQAMAEGTAMQYALGTVSRRPGLYLSRRVDSMLGPLGVVVVKLELDDLEARWRSAGFVVVASDAEGRVVATTEPAGASGSCPGPRATRGCRSRSPPRRTGSTASTAAAPTGRRTTPARRRRSARPRPAGGSRSSSRRRRRSPPRRATAG